MGRLIPLSLDLYLGAEGGMGGAYMASLLSSRRGLQVLGDARYLLNSSCDEAANAGTMVRRPDKLWPIPSKHHDGCRRRKTRAAHSCGRGARWGFIASQFSGAAAISRVFLQP